MILASLILILLLGGIVAWASESLSQNAPKWVAALSLIIAFYPLRFAFAQLGADASQTWLINEITAWIPRFNITFHFAIDGLSLLLVLLTLSMAAKRNWFIVAVVVPKPKLEIQNRTKDFAISA